MPVISEVHGPAVWNGGEIADSPVWRVVLGGEQQAEVLAALASVESGGLPLADFAREDFPLPTLGPVLESLRGELMDGRGFVLLQSIPLTGLGESQSEIIAAGISRHIGKTLPQNAAGAPLLHVRDQGVDPASPTSRSYQHNRRLDFHSDPNDIVALLCIRPAKSGGLSSILSSAAVHNEIVRTRPDLAAVLYEPWWRDRRTGDGPDSFYQSPVYSRDSAGGLVANYGPDYIRSAQRGASVPRLTGPQLEAMETIDRLNNDPRFVLTMDLRPGDMQFQNNYVTMHSRTDYEDHPEPERRRDLLRLWLST